MFIGVDIGGTFTDLITSVDGELHIHKLPSTPNDPAQAMLAGLAVLGATPDAHISHGSTVATNAILERKGARTALITTQGFRDVLAIGRQNRPELYALYPQLVPPLVEREWRLEVQERLDHHGEVIIPLDVASLDDVVERLQQSEIEAVAVCLLYSYINPVHEQAIREKLRDVVDYVSLSCEVLPQFREYERTSTVVLDAYVRPVMDRYLKNLEDALPNKLMVMKSDGGVVQASNARREAIQTALSGPAAGVIGAFHLAQLAGYDHIITLDMGGTSTDVALCPGKISFRPDAEIDGMPVGIRFLDIETVGAGGGSIARVDAGGALRVGPESAGAHPGPMIYGLGGQQITVSDANALLKRLDPEHFLLPLALAPAESAMRALAGQLRLTPHDAARGILDVANVNIVRAIRRVSIERGYDPRDFTLMAFGGAGALHACDVAMLLDMRRVLVPRYPGVLCALGLLVADVVRDYSRTVMRSAGDYAYFEQEMDALIKQAHADLAEEAIPPDRRHFTCEIDMRYRGQSFELTVPFSKALIEQFHRVHHERYGHALREREVEVVNLRLRATGLVDKPAFAPAPMTDNDGTSALIGNGRYQRENLLPGATFTGEALIFQEDSTVYVPPGWMIRVDAYHNLILEYA